MQVIFSFPGQETVTEVTFCEGFWSTPIFPIVADDVHSMACLLILRRLPGRQVRNEHAYAAFSGRVGKSCKKEVPIGQ